MLANPIHQRSHLIVIDTDMTEANMQSDIQMKTQVPSISMMNTEKEYLSAIHRNTSEAWKKIQQFSANIFSPPL